MRWIVFLLSALTFLGCSSEEDPCGLPDLPRRNSCSPPTSRMGLTAIELMQLYVLEQNLTVQKTSDNLWYIIEEPGEEEKPTVSDEVRVDYVGYFRNHCKFDSNDDISFGLENLIEGWKKGIPLIGRCGRIKLIIPPSLAYGNRPPSNIPNGEPLIFDLNLLDF